MPANAIPPLTRMHQERGHDGIQFHYLIDLAGVVHFCRSPERIGRHTRGWNTDSLGIALVGRDKFGPSQWYALANLVEELAAHYQIPLEVPKFVDGRVSGVAGHSDVPNATTRSPNFSVRDWLAGEMAPMRHAHMLRQGVDIDWGARQERWS